jgi:hypothetical protein
MSLSRFFELLEVFDFLFEDLDFDVVILLDHF